MLSMVSGCMHAGRRNGADMRWLQEVRKVGTSADRVAAMTLLLQESAVANLRSLDELPALDRQAQWRAQSGRRPGATYAAGLKTKLCSAPCRSEQSSG